MQKFRGFAALGRAAGKGEAASCRERRLSQWVGARWRGAAGIAGVILLSFLCDSLVARWIPLHPSSMAGSVADSISDFGNLPFLCSYAAMLAMSSYALDRPDWRKLALIMVLGAGLSGIVCTAVRATTGRARPCAEVAQGWYGLKHGSHWVVGRYEYNSFPSGHVATAAGFGGVLFFGARRSAAKSAGLTLIALMAWARVFLRRHHFSDAVAAATAGLLMAWWCWHTLAPKLEEWLERCSVCRAVVFAARAAVAVLLSGREQ